MSSAPPTIFSARRKQARKLRAESLPRRGDGADFLFADMAEEILERLRFVRHNPHKVLCEGPGCPTLAARIAELEGSRRTRYLASDFDRVADAEPASFDLVVSLASLDRVNDLPGALIQMRELLEPGGMAMASFVGGASLPRLRQAMLAAEPDRPAARMHPLVDLRACTQLLQRAGWRNPVADSHVLTVRYGSLDRLVQDLREQQQGNVLASPAPPLARQARERARAAFLAQADSDGRVSETFEILTLTGWR